MRANYSSGNPATIRPHFLTMHSVLVDVFLGFQLLDERIKEDLLVIGSSRLRQFRFLEGIRVIALRGVDSCRTKQCHPIVGILLRSPPENIESFRLFPVPL